MYRKVDFQLSDKLGFGLTVEDVLCCNRVGDGALDVPNLCRYAGVTFVPKVTKSLGATQLHERFCRRQKHEPVMRV